MADPAQQLEHARQLLTESLVRSQEREARVAEHIRSQRDDLTSKIRFGLVALNGASVVAVLTFAGSLQKQLATLGVTDGAIAWAVVSYVAGVVAAGASLHRHQNHLILMAGLSAARAMRYGTAIDLSASRPAPGNELGELLDSFRREEPPDASYSPWALRFQHAASGLWLNGSLALVALVLRHLI